MEEEQSPQACTSTQPLKQARFCCRCRNHGLKIPFKGHRQQCMYKNCLCDSCALVTERRRIVAKQVALKRRQEAKAKKHTEKRPAAALIEAVSSDEEKEDEDEKQEESHDICSEELELNSSSPSLEDHSFNSTSSSEEDQPLIINCSPSTFVPESPASPTESPAMEMHSSECGSGVIRVGQVVFKPIQSQDETFVSYSSPIHSPLPATASYSPISPEKENPDFTEIADFNRNVTVPPISNLSFSRSSKFTPNAPSYGLTAGVISSSNPNLSRMYPYDNTGIVNRMAASSNFPAPTPVTPSSVAPFSVTAGPSNSSISAGSSSSHMNVLMRIFPEHKPQFLQTALESCGGDPIQCIETMWNMQDSEQDKKTAIQHVPDKPSNLCPPTPGGSPLYIQPPKGPPPPYPTKLSISSGPVSPVVTNQQQQYHPSAAGVMTSTAGCAARPATYHLPLHFANAAVMHQSLTAGSTVTYPEAHTPNLYLGGPGTYQDAVTLSIPTSFGSFLSPVGAPHISMHNIPPSAPSSGLYPLPSVPTLQQSPHQVPIHAPTVHVKQEHCNYQIDSTTQHQSSIPSCLTPTKTTQMYCQTIGRIQPGKCLSYTSLQTVASTNPSTKPILMPLMTEGVGVRDNQTIYTNNHSSGGEHLSGASSAFSRWFDPHPAALTNSCTADETQPQQYASFHLPPPTHHLGQLPMTPQQGSGALHHGALPMIPHFGPGAPQLTPHLGPGAPQLTPQYRTDAAAAHVLMSLGTSPMRKHEDQATTIKDLLMEEE